MLPIYCFLFQNHSSIPALTLNGRSSFKDFASSMMVRFLRVRPWRDMAGGKGFSWSF